MRLVKLTKQSDRTPIYVNPDHIVDVAPIQGGTQITTVGINTSGASRSVVVKEDLSNVVYSLTT